jgi:hypothetical protein
MHNEMRNNTDYDPLLAERNYLSTEDASELKAVLEPLNKAKKELSSKNAEFVTLKAQRSRVKSALRKSKTNETRLKHKNTLDEIDTKVGAMGAEVEALHAKVREIDGELITRAKNGEFKKQFYFTDKEGMIGFRNPDELPKFRPLVHEMLGVDESIAHETAAKGYYQTIMGNTSEQLHNGLLSTMFPGRNMESPFKARSLLIPDEILRKAGFLDNDLSKGLASYSLSVGKKTALKEVFPDVGSTDGLVHISERLAKEHQDNREKIKKEFDGEKRKKKLRKLESQFKKDQSFLRNMLETAQGNTRYSETTQANLGAIRNLTVATRLGNVPLTQITDLMAVQLKHGVWPFLRDGLRPAFTTINGKINTAEGEALRENASHALVAMQHVMSGHMDKMWANASITEIPITGPIQSGLSKMAHISGNVYGTNYVDNAMHRITANIMQSKVMNMMFKYKAGKLSRKEIDYLMRYRLDPAEWADRFIAEFKNSGGWKVTGGGYQSKYYDWADDAAKIKMGDTLRRGVKDTVLQKGMFEAPFFMNNPIGNTLFMFKGWAFSATNRYFVPLAQRPDAEKMLSAILMTGMGAFVDPLRKWSRGQQASLNDDDWFMGAITNGGVFGILADGVQEANALLGQPFFKTSDRWKQRTFANSFGGAGAGVVSDMIQVIGMFATGRINERDMKKLVRLTPLMQGFYFNQLNNKWIESMGLPKTPREAELSL